MDTKKILIYGAGGFGREVAWLIESCKDVDKPYHIVGFIDDDLRIQGKVHNGIAIHSLDEARFLYPSASIVRAIGSPQVSQAIMERCQNLGYDFETIIHPRVERSQWIEMGAGTVICAGCILTTNIVLGRHVQINLDCTIGHDVRMDDYTTLAPGVHVSGWVHIGKRVYIGTGAVILNGSQGRPVVIGDDTVIGAGACVTKTIAQGQVVFGVPARQRVRADKED
jgi:sugar O-acyltransferase (sialic acid O-acetyltransferase NeuD family)